MSHNFFFFFFNDTATTEIYTLSLHDALPILKRRRDIVCWFMSRSSCRPRWSSSPIARTGRPCRQGRRHPERRRRSEEHTSELQSPCNLVCRLLLEKKKTQRLRAFTDPLHRND